MIIKQMKMEVASQCNNHCTLCAHRGLISYSPNYQLQLEDLSYFLKVTEASNYFIENVRIHGPGEPTLWKYFNEGIEILSQSKAIGSIFVATNGFHLKNIADNSFKKINEMRVSIYENFENHTLLKSLIEKYGAKINTQDMTTFRKVLLEDPADIPCDCICMGPMLYGKHLYYYCGPPVFDAIEYLGESIERHKYLFCDVKPHYMKHYESKKKGNLSLCKFCWANSSCQSMYECWSMS